MGDTVRHGLDLIIPSVTIGAGAIAGIGAICVGAKKETPWLTIVLPSFILLCIVAAGLISVFSDQLFGAAFNPMWLNFFLVLGTLFITGTPFILLTSYNGLADYNESQDKISQDLKDAVVAPSQPPEQRANRAALDELFAKGHLTQEEYNLAVQKNNNESRRRLANRLQ